MSVVEMSASEPHLPSTLTGRPNPNASHSSKTDQQEFCVALVRNLTEMNAREPHPQSTLRGRSKPHSSQITCHEA